tara:strand:+ start:32947 stop:33426 length:480 start_codon:yes stop_codon:yes gene_type:complete
MKTLNYYFIAFLISITAHSQSSVVSSGGDILGPSGSISYSIGQTFYLTSSNNSHQVSTGVQQSVLDGTLTIGENDKLYKRYIVFPNPFENYFYLRIPVKDIGDMSYKLYDFKYLLTSSKKIRKRLTKIYVTGNRPYMLFLEVLNKNKTVKVFKLFKNEH